MGNESTDLNKSNPVIETNSEKVKEEEFQIIKNNIIYNIKLILEKSALLEKVEIIVSFVLNNSFHIYKAYLDKFLEIEKLSDHKEIYQNLIKEIKGEKLEIIHEGNNDKYILVKIVFNNEIKTIKLLKAGVDNKIIINNLIKNYTSLENKYIQLKKEFENYKENQPMELDDENDSPDYEVFDDNNNNNIYNKNTIFERGDENHIVLDTTSKIRCMLNLNKIIYKENNENKYLNLIGLGMSNDRIILIDINTMKIHQEIFTTNTVYSLAQFKDDSNYLICSLSNGQMIIYILKENKYEEFQVLEKPPEIKKDEINKVITLSDGNIATAERGAVSIWKPKMEEGQKKFEFFKELKTNNDTCQLLEVNPEIFVCAIYRSKVINIYKNDGIEFPLLGQITDAHSHGSNSNAMTKINDNIFCSGGDNCCIYIVSVEPVQLIQKIILQEEDEIKYNNYIRFLHNSNDGFIFTSFGEGIIQYKIIKDEDNNYITLEKFDDIEDGKNNSSITTTKDGKIFYSQINEQIQDKTNLFLTKYKQLNE